MSHSPSSTGDRREFLQWLGRILAGAALSPRLAWAEAKTPGQTGRTGLLYHDIFKEHLTGPDHPESPGRMDAILAALRAAGIDAQTARIAQRAIRDPEVLTCHTAEYLNVVKRDVSAGRRKLTTGDVKISRRSLEVARRAAGGVLAATEAVIQGRVKNAFCAVRPPGHHARPAQGMGFCIFNNVAVAARYAQRTHGMGKVLIVDWDVHHGNGTQDIFYEDGSVFYFSTHQWPWYPGTGRRDETGQGRGRGTTMNFPLPAGSGRKDVLGAMQDRLVPAMDRFKPELVLISAGFDSRRGDPLGRFTLDDNDFTDMTELLLKIARTHARGRLVSVLEGGYNLRGLARAVTAHVRALMAAPAGRLRPSRKASPPERQSRP